MLVIAASRLISYFVDLFGMLREPFEFLFTVKQLSKKVIV